MAKAQWAQQPLQLVHRMGIHYLEIHLVFTHRDLSSTSSPLRSGACVILVTLRVALILGMIISIVGWLSLCHDTYFPMWSSCGSQKWRESSHLFFSQLLVGEDLFLWLKYNIKSIKRLHLGEGHESATVGQLRLIHASPGRHCHFWSIARSCKKGMMIKGHDLAMPLKPDISGPIVTDFHKH